MANLFESSPDKRQDDNTPTPSRFRPRYRKLSDEEVALHDDIKTKAQEFEALIEKVGPGRYASLAMTHLEISVMFAVKELTK